MKHSQLRSRFSSMIKLAYTLALFFITMPLSYFAWGDNQVVVIPFDGEKQAYLERVIYVPANASATVNGQALFDAIELAKTMGASAASPWLIQLEPGFYGIAAHVINITTGINLRGANANKTTIYWSDDVARFIVNSTQSNISHLFLSNASGFARPLTVSGESRLRLEDINILARRFAVQVNGACTSNQDLIEMIRTEIHVIEHNFASALELSGCNALIDHSRFVGYALDADGPFISVTSANLLLLNSYIQDNSNAIGTGTNGNVLCRNLSTPSTYSGVSCP